MSKYFNDFLKIKNILNEYSFKLLELLNSLNTTEYKFNKEFVYNIDNNSKEICKWITFDSIFIKTEYGIINDDIEWLLNFKLSNGKTIRYNQLEISHIFDIVEMINEMSFQLQKYNDENKIIPQRIHIENKDIIITDPCYIIKRQKQHSDYNNLSKKEYEIIEEMHNYKEKINEEWRKQGNFTIQQIYDFLTKIDEYKRNYEEIKRQKYNLNKDDWEDTDYGQNLKAIGFNNYISRNTIYGDWSCTTFNENTDEPIGDFCADSGMVAVLELDEVLKYNPDFNYHIEKPWTTTLIKNFTGDVWFEIEHTEGEYEDNSEYHKKGDKWSNDTVHVIGKGNINFITNQTGF